MTATTQLGKIAAAATLCALFAAPQAQAATAPGTLAVTAVVLNVCIVATTPVVFANYTLLQSDVSGLITVTCTGAPASYNIGLGAGAAPGATTSTRKMTSLTTATLLDYGLFRDAARSQNWGSTIGTDTLDVTAPGLIGVFTVYGRLPANQNSVAAGAYLDTVAVTVTY